MKTQPKFDLFDIVRFKNNLWVVTFRQKGRFLSGKSRYLYFLHYWEPRSPGPKEKNTIVWSYQLDRVTEIDIKKAWKS
jgi:hypothetical protein